MTTADLEFDKEHLWHPYTSLTKPLKVYPVDSAAGCTIKLSTGEVLVDGMASWWSAIHGYNHPVLNKAATEQLARMSHVMFGGLTHQPAIDLGKKLVEITPKGLDRIFLCDSGSIAVEVAMKMAIQYQQALGFKGKTKFLTIKKGYHGDTTGAMSVCDPVSGMHHLFQDFAPQHCFMEEPQKSFDENCNAEDEKNIAAFFEQYANQAAAFILEPIVQGAGGMRVYAPDYLKLIRTYCNQYNLLLIADEIATGFGRTGKMFAVEHANVLPDILCVGKALTGGYMTLAATICTKHVADTICNGEAGVMMHGPTFMGNPLACAVALASLNLLTQMDWQNRILDIEKQLKEKLGPALESELVTDVRIKGAIGVLETKYPVDVEKTQAYFIERAVWIRPFRNLLYIMPPYVISEAELELVCKVMVEAVQEESLFLIKNEIHV